MARRWRRFEILLPHDRRTEAFVEIAKHFGIVSTRDKGPKVWLDEHGKTQIDVPDAVSNREWIKRFKDRWQKKLGKDVWIVSHRIEIE